MCERWNRVVSGRRQLYVSVYGDGVESAYTVYLFDTSSSASDTSYILWLIICLMLLVAVVFVAVFVYKVRRFNQFRYASLSLALRHSIGG